ncbi:S8 family serine peptidase [Desulfosporosinus sp. FKB]|uniref:S8 family serine peptidase n=1 Tax=Desulfosporosinus sp. FKB TaxID=1969835 RepID=UPI000B49D5AD|nr:S8 family serine peptidase [Desulfosporosinus sp. FKB]
MSDSKGNKTTNICRINGTSAAAPLVICLAAAIMVENPSLSPKKTMEIILNSADINKSDKNYEKRPHKKAIW